jgi:hypothetical protein
VLLERGGSILGRVVTPELIDQAVARDDAARVEQEQGEQAALFDPSQASVFLPLADLERAEDVEVGPGSQSATVPRASAA